MKRLKPGQLCTINKHVYRCKKAPYDYTCTDCRKANKTEECMLGPNKQKPTFAPQLMCIDIFGLDNYPELVK